jgi:multicomponent Na+:H+ antiporter subunit A
VLFVAVAGIVGVRPFLGQRRDTPQDPHRAPLRLWLGPFLLAAAGLGAGLWCEPVGSTLLAPAVSAVLRQPVTVELALWHGWTATLFLSLVSVLAGVGLYAGRHAVYRAAALGRQVAQWGPARGYERLLAALYRLAEVQTRLLQSGYLRYYLLMTLVSTVGLVGWTLVRQGEITGAELGGAIYVHEAWLAGLIVAASVVTIRSRSRLTAIAALGVVGYSVALLFVLLGAPDLAIAQFLIETLMVILFVLVLYHLPGYTLMSLPRARFRDAVVALTAGCMITALVLVTAQVQWYEPISEYFIRHSLSQAHGRNIVNVILVDFRGIDTLGEITVLAVAALGVYALLKLRPGAASETEDDS